MAENQTTISDIISECGCWAPDNCATAGRCAATGRAPTTLEPPRNHAGARKSIPAMSENQTTACEWIQDEPGSDAWNTDCGHVFTIFVGIPSENRMTFCCYCGKPLKETVL